MKIRRANLEDGFKIIELYHEVYQGAYQDPMMTQFQYMKEALLDKNTFWFVADNDGAVVASMVVKYDPDHLLGKALGGAVLPSQQGQGLLTQMMEFSFRFLGDHTEGLDVIYATTRSVNEAAQSLVEKMGYKKLGIFPNTHRNIDYETHSLAAWYAPHVLGKRFINYKMHYQLKDLFELVKSEVPLEEPNDYIVPLQPTRTLSLAPILEIIHSKYFVNYRYDYLIKNHALQFEFFPFVSPNLMVVSPDQSVEIFANLSHDGHCVIIGGKVGPHISYTDLLLKINLMLRDAGARYIETIIRADKPKILDSIIKAKMIPSAFFPALQLKDGMRYDFFVFSKSFEVFDFQNIKLKGLNQRFLEEYYKSWKNISLYPKLLDV